MQSGLQESDETGYWFELLIESGRISESKLGSLMSESEELIAIFASSIKTSRDAGD